MKKITPILIIVLFYTQAFSQIENIGEKINLENLKEHITFLASDSLEGQEVGQPGETMAAEYMSNYFKEIGIPPYKDSTYYQTIPLEKRTLESVSFFVGGEEYKFKEDFYTYPSFNEVEIKSDEIVFLGYGLDTKTYSDYSVNVEGKIIVIFNDEPKDTNGKYIVSGGKERCPESGWRFKLNKAKEKGVAAVLFITENYKSNYKKAEHKIEEPGVSLVKQEVPIPFFYISEEIDVLGKNKLEKFKKNKIKNNLQ